MKTFERKPTDVLPRAQIGNRLGAQCLYDHYVGGMTLGSLARRLGLKKGSLASFEKVAANRLESARSGIASFSGSRTRKFRRRTTSRSGGSGRSSSPASSASDRSRRTASAYARRSSR